MFKYYGSKYRLADKYPKPLHGHIIEPFGGSAAYAVRHRNTVTKVTIAELDLRIVQLWDRLLSTTSDDIREMPVPEVGSRCDDLLVALAAGRTTRDTPESFIVSPRMAQRFTAMTNRIANTVDECRFFTVRHCSYLELEMVSATWFVDPPYQPNGGRWDRTRGGRYKHANRYIDYRKLSEWTQALPGQVIACDQDGANWLPFNNRIITTSGSAAHTRYGEVFWTKT